MLQEAATHLEQAHTALTTVPPDYEAVPSHSLQAIHLSLRAFLRWHSVPFDRATPLKELVRCATQLASSLTTPAGLALKLAEVAEAVQGKAQLSVTERDLDDLFRAV